MNSWPAGSGGGEAAAAAAGGDASITRKSSKPEVGEAGSAAGKNGSGQQLFRLKSWQTLDQASANQFASTGLASPEMPSTTSVRGSKKNMARPGRATGSSWAGSS